MSQKIEDTVWSDHHKLDQLGFGPDISPEESQEFYKQWAKIGTYDKVMGTPSKLDVGLNKICNAMKQLFPNPEKPLVLDVGAGTGLAGETLKRHGFSNMDCLEPQPGFIELCKKKNIYRKFINEYIGTEQPLNIPDNTYDVVATSRAFAGGHIPCNAVPEMIRITKPGGYVVNVMREEYLWTVAEYKDRLQPLMDQLEAQGKWKKIKWEVFPRHYLDKTGILMVYQVC